MVKLPSSQIFSSLIIISLVLVGSFNIPSEVQYIESTIRCHKQEIIEPFSRNQIKGEHLGEQNSFWVFNPNTDDYQQSTAKLLSIGQYCYIYVDLVTIGAIGETEAIEISNNYSLEFDSVMYPTNLDLVGHPDGFIGDIDGDPKITVLITPFSYGGVYFYKDDNPTHPYSNNREMVYIHPNLSMLGGYGTLIHELNHLIWFNHEQDEAIFVLEGTAEYTRYKAGYLNDESYIIAQKAANYNLTYRTNDFKTHPESSLLYWDYDDPILNRASYGRSYMFMLYLSERFGEDFLTDLVTITEDGPAGIETALKNRGLNFSFNEIYLDWITACTIDLVDFSDGKYGYRTADFKIDSVTHISQLPSSSEINQYKLYGFNVKKLNYPPNDFTIKITNPKPFALGVSLIIKDKNGWNITQAIHYDDSDEISLFVSGNEINFAYIITSMISINTPAAASFNNPGIVDPTKNLAVTILEGHINSETTENAKYIPIITSVCLAFFVHTVRRIKKKVLKPSRSS
ncbi:MAG: hypothetical protein ACTSPM_04120 [Candidatus Heimdallarchaeota archaeon]